MRRVLAFLVKWTILAAVAAVIGGAMGAAYATNLKEPPVEEALAPHPYEPPTDPAPAEKTKDLVAPPAPVLLAPRNGALVSWTPLLRWEPVSDASNVIYTIELSADPGFPQETTTIVRNLQTTEWRTDSAFAPLATTYWRVRALDAALNEGPWSDAWSFTPVLPVGDAEVSADVAPAVFTES